MPKQSFRDGQLNLLLPISPSHTRSNDQRAVKKVEVVREANPLSYGSVMASLKKKGLVGPKK